MKRLFVLCLLVVLFGSTSYAWAIKPITKEVMKEVTENMIFYKGYKEFYAGVQKFKDGTEYVLVNVIVEKDLSEDYCKRWAQGSIVWLRMEIESNDGSCNLSSLYHYKIAVFYRDGKKLVQRYFGYTDYDNKCPNRFKKDITWKN